MKNVRVSDELYDKLKDFVVDPFDDTLETIVNRLVDIAHKAKARWTLADADENTEPPEEEQELYSPSGAFRTKPLREATAL